MTTTYIITRSDELCHEGVKGMHWGERRWQYEDGSLTPEGYVHYGVNPKNLNKTMSKGIRDSKLTEAHTIPKGTKIYRVTSDKDDYDSGTTYVSYMDMDRQHYRSGWIRNNGNTGKAYEHTMELQEDLNIPSRKEVQEVVNSVMKDNQKLVEKTCKAWLDVAIPKDTWERIEIMYANTGDEKEAQKAWKDYTKDVIKNFKNMTPSSAAFFVMQSFGLNKEVRQKVIDELTKRGYNAMTDEASVGGQNGYAKEGGDPLIVFDRSNKFKEVSNNEISRKDERKSLMQYNKIKSQISKRNSNNW